MVTLLSYNPGERLVKFFSFLLEYDGNLSKSVPKLGRFPSTAPCFLTFS